MMHIPLNIFILLRLYLVDPLFAGAIGFLSSTGLGTLYLLVRQGGVAKVTEQEACLAAAVGIVVWAMWLATSTRRVSTVSRVRNRASPRIGDLPARPGSDDA